MDRAFRLKNAEVWTLGVLLVFCFSACVSHLGEAKLYYAKAQSLDRSYQRQEALGAFKLAKKEAELEIQRHPSAQAFMIKGMTEIKLEQWKKAEESFLQAFAYGFDKGEEWAEHLSLFGLAASLQELGLEETATGVYLYLVGKCKIKEILLLAVQKYTDLALREAMQEDGSKRQKNLKDLLKTLEKLSEKDLSCGYYHYVQSQVFSHLLEYRKSFEKAVLARELGLPSLEIFRDNDNQIVFCFRKLREGLSPSDWETFHSLYLSWIKRWEWPDAETPDWKKR